MMIVKCKECGKEFKTHSCWVKNGRGKFCGHKCKGIWYSKNLIGAKRYNWKGGKIEVKCLECGSKIAMQPWRIKNGNGKFCSRKCHDLWRSKNKTGKNNPHWQGGKIPRICKVCGKEFSVNRFTVKVGQGIFCSKGCQDKGFSGKNSPNWKGGITPIALHIRESKEYKAWRLSVFERDYFTCKYCGEHGVKIHAHHKKKFSELIQEVRDNFPLFDLFNGAMAYLPLWDLNNGVTLCEKCHRKTNNYGNRKKL